MNRYEEYKKVNLIWLKEIPSHWEIIPISHVFEERRERNNNGNNQFILSVMKNIGVIPYTDKGNVGNKASENIENYKVVYPNDLVLNSMNMMIGSLGKSNYKGVLSQVYYVLKLMNSSKYSIDYLNYLFKNKVFHESFRVLGKGILDHRLRVPIQLLKYEKILIPPINEQEQIANYLDWKINEIDRLIQIEKKKIKELQKLKEINFNKIINSSQHNKSIKIKFFANLYGRIGWQGLNSSEYGDEGIYLITGTDFYNGTIDFSKCVRVPEFRWYQNDKIQIKNGDLLITKDGTVGKLAIVTNLVEKATLNSGIMKIDFFRNDIVTKEYLFYILKSNIFKSWFIDLNVGFATIIHLYQKDFYNFSFKYPEMREQEIIVSKIKKLESVFNNQIAKIEESIKTLELLKQSLISEVVTGKIDVRNIAIPEYEKVTVLDDQIEEFDEMEVIEDGN
ncbi:restriction endonuclease subunit S [Mesomycoplasma ovipneumoniae]|uniref:restriction endonuclease subunit S n=1 Tax=Mesomycoplasma ovipneumoniae TaxID=29562 RepID=UPI002964D581|nr:restriction endonuclease subunit S [Mesomycoplasma ovipneumoniae]MDW2924510.1 restriction endonuclease subunit S [Mesomycoplasma ovipneumoniae]